MNNEQTEKGGKSLFFMLFLHIHGHTYNIYHIVCI